MGVAAIETAFVAVDDEFIGVAAARRQLLQIHLAAVELLVMEQPEQYITHLVTPLIP